MMPWDAKETRISIEKLYGRKQVDVARGALRSVIDRKIYARIHYEDAASCVEKYTKEKLLNTSLLFVLMGGEDGSTEEFEVFIRRVGAHVIACIQSIHTLPDILAHAIYYSLALDVSSKQLEQSKITRASVSRLLRLHADGSELAEILTELATGGAFGHLSALANQCKHRSIVFPSLNEDLTGERPDRHQVVLGRFEHNGIQYSEVTAFEFLEREYSRCAALVVKAGNVLNAVLQARLQQAKMNL
jgi:hypothetical protein